MNGPQVPRYRVEDAIGIAENIVVPEPDHAIAISLDHTASLGIGLFRVLATIGFDHQPGTNLARWLAKSTVY